MSADFNFTKIILSALVSKSSLIELFFRVIFNLMNNSASLVKADIRLKLFHSGCKKRLKLIFYMDQAA